MSTFSIDQLIEKVKLKLNFIDYEGDISIPDDVIRKHLETAKTLIDSVFDPDSNSNSNNIKSSITQYLYEECITEYAKYLTMVSWAANAIDIEKTPGTWSTVLQNELRVLRSLLLQLIGDEAIVNQLLGEEQKGVEERIAIPKVVNSHNLLTRYFIR